VTIALYQRRATPVMKAPRVPTLFLSPPRILLCHGFPTPNFGEASCSEFSPRNDMFFCPRPQRQSSPRLVKLFFSSFRAQGDQVRFSRFVCTCSSPNDLHTFFWGARSPLIRRDLNVDRLLYANCFSHWSLSRDGRLFPEDRSSIEPVLEPSSPSLRYAS